MGVRMVAKLCVCSRPSSSLVSTPVCARSEGKACVLRHIQRLYMKRLNVPLCESCLA